MKTIPLAIALFSPVLSCFSQGDVQFANGPATLISFGPAGNEMSLPANEAGAFYFGLLISSNGSAPFTFTGVYATNSDLAGTIGPATYTPLVPGWPGATPMYYEVAGWSANLGAVWNPGWLVNNAPARAGDPVWSGTPTNSYFGLSRLASGAAAGPCPPSCGPAYPLFGGTGLAGFNLDPVVATVGLSATVSGQGIVVTWSPPGSTLESSPVVGPGAVWSTVGTQSPMNFAIATGPMFFRVAGGLDSNIVGFATVTVGPGYNLLANPLDDGRANAADEIMPVLDGEEILTLGAGDFIEVMYDSTAGGWVNADDVTLAVPPSLPPGKGFFFFNPGTTPTNFTFVGQVVPGPSSTNCLTVDPGFNLFGSPLPAAVDTITNIPVRLPVIDGMAILQWSDGKYVLTMYDSTAGGWVQIDDTTPSKAPPYSIGQGFFFFNPGGTAVVWCQSLP